MRFFSRSASDYFRFFKWPVVALFAVGLVRFLLQPLGVPFETGNLIASTMILLMILVVSYSIYFGLSRGGIGDLLAATSTFVFAQEVAMAIALIVGYVGGIDSYYSHPSAIGAAGNVPRHLVAHVVTTFIMIGYGMVVSLVFWGLARVSRGALGLVRGRGPGPDSV